MKITWVNLNVHRSPDENGYWKSLEGRFGISPNYRQTVYPDSYTVRDNTTTEKHSFDQVRRCKEWAGKIVIDEITKEIANLK